MEQNQLLQRKAAGLKSLNAWMTLPSPEISEIIARQGWQSICFDMQHGLIQMPELGNLLRPLIGQSVTPIVRVPGLSSEYVAQALENGATGIIMPMLENPDEVKRFLDYCYYPPAGKRSYNSASRSNLLYSGSELEKSDDLILPMIMIETKPMVLNLAEIVAMEGLRGIYIGPSDLALAYGYQPDPDASDPRLRELIAEIYDIASEHELLCAIHGTTTDTARHWFELGFDLATVGSDIRFIRGSGEAIMQEMTDYCN